MSENLLPTWDGPRGGSGCDNPDCPATPRYVTVMSVQEIERVFPSKQSLPWWPVPEQATHVCTRCGFCYQGRSDLRDFTEAADISDRPEVDLSEWDWDPEESWGDSARNAAIAFIEGAPEDATADEIAEGVARHVPGLGKLDARELITELDVDVVQAPMSDYM